MKAIKIFEPGDMQLVECEKPRITGDTDILVKVAAAGICGSDVHIFHGRNPYAKYPVIPGHEESGVVEAVGPGVTKFKVGDRVVVEPIQYCGRCYPCRIGRPNVCEELQVYGCHLNGGFAEYMLAAEAATHRIPASVSFKQAALIEPLTIGAQAMYRTGARIGDLCLIHGAGPIGLITLTLAKQNGLTAMVSEPSDARRAMAKEFGADLVIHPMEEDLAAKVMDFTDGKGANIIFDAVGVPALVEQSIPLLSAAGRFLEFGYGFGAGKVDFDRMNKLELTVMGLRHQTFRFDPVIDIFPSILDKVDKIQTHTFALEQFEEAFRTFTDKNSGACKVTFLL